MADRFGVQFEDVIDATQAPRRVARLIAKPAELRGIALTDAFALAPAVRFGLDRLTGEQLPGVLVARQHPFVREQDRGARRV
ncbi:MAG TPA: hypothetical protein VIK08_02265 [Candidatus Limnocylindrales bacterium]